MQISHTISDHYSSIILTIILLTYQIPTYGRRKDTKAVIHSFHRCSGQYILLTFDGISDEKNTIEALDILSQKNKVATFFISSVKLKVSLDIIRRIAREGHEIEMQRSGQSVRNRTSTIFNNLKLKPIAIRIVDGNGSSPLNYLRMEEESLFVIQWNADATDLQGSEIHPITTNFAKNLKPGDIIRYSIAHATSMRSLPILIDSLDSLGYEFLTISAMISFPNDAEHRKLLPYR